MPNGHLIEVTTHLVCDAERREYYGVAAPDAILARELVIAERVITTDQTVRAVSSLATGMLASLRMLTSEVRYFGASEPDDSPVRVASSATIPCPALISPR